MSGGILYIPTLEHCSLQVMQHYRLQTLGDLIFQGRRGVGRERDGNGGWGRRGEGGGREMGREGDGKEDGEGGGWEGGLGGRGEGGR